MKALFFSLPLTGHVHPSLGLVCELARRGDEVVYYSTPRFARMIGEAQAAFRPYRNLFLADLTGLPARLNDLSALLARTTEEVLLEELETARAEQPDYVIADSVAPWGQWVGQILGVPVITSISTLAFNRHVLMFAAKHKVQPRSARTILGKLRAVLDTLRTRGKLRRRYGVRGTGVMGFVAGSSDLNIVYTSRYFQPCAETFDERFVFAGPSLNGRLERSWGVPFGDVPLAYISLGTLFNTDVSFYRTCFEAFSGSRLQVILSVGGHVDIASLGEAPANFVVRAHVPQLEVLQRASVFVTHGGMNSVSESLWHGVPMVVIPQMSEQAIVGRRVEELGAGVYLAKEEVSARKLSELVMRVKEEGRFRTQARVAQDSFRNAGGVACAADAIFRFTRGHASARAC